MAMASSTMLQGSSFLQNKRAGIQSSQEWQMGSQYKSGRQVVFQHRQRWLSPGPKITTLNLRNPGCVRAEPQAVSADLEPDAKSAPRESNGTSGRRRHSDQNIREEARVLGTGVGVSCALTGNTSTVLSTYCIAAGISVSTIGYGVCSTMAMKTSTML